LKGEVLTFLILTTLQEVWELIQLCDLAVDLSKRMNDPKRLFVARGNTLIKEEEDRKKVNLIPKKSRARQN
jgi:hypothetical protein